MKVKDFNFEQFLDKEEAEYHFMGYASTYGNVDRQGDVMAKGCFDEFLKNKTTVPMLFNHDRNQVIGKLMLSADDKGLIAKGVFNLDIPKAHEVYAMCKHGDIDSMSIGFLVEEHEPINKERPYGAWKMKKVDIVETSVVTIPANDMAKIESVKAQRDEQCTRKMIQQVLDEKAIEDKRKDIIKTLEV